MEPRWRELPLLKPDREDRSALLREYSAHTAGDTAQVRRAKTVDWVWTTATSAGRLLLLHSEGKKAPHAGGFFLANLTERHQCHCRWKC